MTIPANKKVRDMTPDVARGFALWGIIVVNVAYFSTSVTNGVTGDSMEGAADGVAAFVVQAFALGKFYLLFSFLFGYSAQYVMKDTLGGRRRWTLRNVGLVVLGVLHASLFYTGDILFLYGILGMLLIVFVGRSDWSITAWAKGDLRLHGCAPHEPGSADLGGGDFGSDRLGHTCPRLRGSSEVGDVFGIHSRSF